MASSRATTGTCYTFSSLLNHGSTKVKMWLSWHPDLCSYSQVTLPQRTQSGNCYMLMKITVFPKEVNSVYRTLTVSQKYSSYHNLLKKFVSVEFCAAFIRELIQEISQQRCCCWAIDCLTAIWRTYQVAYAVEIGKEGGQLKALVSDSGCPKEHHQLLKMCLQKIALL